MIDFKMKCLEITTYQKISMKFVVCRARELVWYIGKGKEISFGLNLNPCDLHRFKCLD